MSTSQASRPGARRGSDPWGRWCGHSAALPPELGDSMGSWPPRERQGLGRMPSGLRGTSVFEGRWPLHPGTRVHGQRGSVQLQRLEC